MVFSRSDLRRSKASNLESKKIKTIHFQILLKVPEFVLSRIPIDYVVKNGEKKTTDNDASDSF